MSTKLHYIHVITTPKDLYVTTLSSSATKLHDVDWHTSGTQLPTNQRPPRYRALVIYRLFNVS